MKISAFLAGALLCLPLTQALAQSDFSTVEERMTGQEFRETGLYKLTDEELAALNRWIAQRSLAEGQSLSPAAAGGPAVTESGEVVDRRGLRDDSDERPIESRIVGSFSGWDGDTEFVLENGMVWEQTDGQRFNMSTMENPRVTIEPGFMGSWRLQVEGYNARVQVRRIR
ncbi:hypothetical protein [Wenzhouxiangella marina]|uniref:Uncharacterized protein n=1 Tax=Wenzhouxiangella marina TaxID=1579979 RepID=A0A0K0XZF2_9GAMM|nr:hypothetical protein [Wenzhouxiangella marina]AKS43064.1 hypothetical protein WM2015_2706 [Wenzhouxiangella marina]MBB6087252.1 hypothetical protein [Wenzhouxiangella marina]